MVVLGITTILSYGTSQYLFGVLVVPVSITFHMQQGQPSSAYSLGLVLSGLLGCPHWVIWLIDGERRVLMTLGSALAWLSLIGLALCPNTIPVLPCSGQQALGLPWP